MRGKAILMAAACLFAAQNALANETTLQVVNKAANGLAQMPPMGWNSCNKSRARCGWIRNYARQGGGAANIAVGKVLGVPINDRNMEGFSLVS